MTRDLRLFLVIISRNNASTLPDVVEAALAAGFDLLVIDDGSVDQGLAAIAHLPCRTHRFVQPRGYGAAVHEGAMLAARLGYDTMVTLAGDGRHNPADAKLLAARAEQLGNPSLIVGVAAGQPSPIRFLLRLECGLDIPEPASLFRLYPVRELLTLRIDRQSDHFVVESIVRFVWSGIPVVTMAVTGLDTAEREALDDTGGPHVLTLALLHSRLLARRLLPLPHQRFTPEEPLRKKIAASLAQNPFRVLARACREHSSPLWLAMAVWLGIFMGALPLLSIHTIAIIYVAHRLHVNKVAAVAASQFCMPPVVPALCIEIGYYLRKGELLLDLSWQRWLLEIPERLWEWLIGSLLLGPLLGFIGAGAMYWIAKKLQTEKC